MPHTQDIRLAVEDQVAWITMDRQERMNALSRRAFAELVELALAADAMDEVRVIVFSGAGTRAFSAGVDLKELDAAGSMLHPMREPARNLNEVVLEMTKPTIAAINGVAAGGGCELALACDIRIASVTARIGLPEARVGMGANFGSVVLPQLIPRGLALELLFTGELIDARRALDLGLVNRVVEHDQLHKEVSTLASRIASNAPLSVQRMKAMAFKSLGMPVPAGLRLSAGPDPYTSEDRHEGARAFAEKRPPVFRGR